MDHYQIPLPIPSGCNVIMVLLPQTHFHTPSLDAQLSKLSLDFSPVTLVNNTNLIQSQLHPKNESFAFVTPPLLPQNQKLQNVPFCRLVFLFLLTLRQSVFSSLLLNRILTRETLYFLSPQDLPREKVKNLNLFQSSRFEIAHPNLILILRSGSGSQAVNYIILPICYLCPSLKSYEYSTLHIQQDSTNLPLNISHLSHLLFRLNSHGHGHPAYVTGISDNNTESIRGLEIEMRRNWESGYTVKTLLGILSSHLNFTISTSPILGGRLRPRLRVCNHCEPEDRNLPEARYSHNIMHLNEESFFYCTRTATLTSESPYSFLLAPFDVWIWGGILGSIILTGLTFRSPWFSMNVVWGLLGIPYLKGWTRYKLLVVVSASLLILQYYYVAFFTSDIILPFLPLQVGTPTELFNERGFRLVRTSCDSPSDWVKYVERNNETFMRHGLNPSPETFILIDPSCGSEEGYMRAGKLVGAGTSLIQTKFVKQTTTKVQKRYPLYYCNVAKLAWDVVTVTMNFDAHLSRVFGEALSSLQSNGIGEYFEGLYLAGAKREAMKGTGVEGKFGGSKAGHLFSLFKLVGIMLVFCGGCFIGEILLTRIKSWAMRRKK